MAHAYTSPEDDLPLVIKTTSMYKVFKDVDALLEEAYSVIGRRHLSIPQTDAYSLEGTGKNDDGGDLDEALRFHENEIEKAKKNLSKSSKSTDNSDSYETCSSELEESGKTQLKKKTMYKAKSKRIPSASPADRVRIHTAKGNMDFGETEDDKYKRAHMSKGGDADAVVDINNNEWNFLMNPSPEKLHSSSKGQL